MCIRDSNEDDNSFVECTDDLNRAEASLANCVGDTSIALSTIADDNAFVEVKAAYAKEMVTGFMKLNGITVGAVANRCEVYNDEGCLLYTSSRRRPLKRFFSPWGNPWK